MVDFTLNIRSKLVWEKKFIQKKIYGKGAPSPRFENSLRMLITKSTTSQKLTKTIRKIHELQNPFQNIAHLLG